MQRWVTMEKASELTGFGESFLHDRTSPTTGHWAEGELWKWFDGRKVLDLDALYRLIDEAPSVPSRRGRRKQAEG